MVRYWSSFLCIILSVCNLVAISLDLATSLRSSSLDSFFVWMSRSICSSAFCRLLMSLRSLRDLAAAVPTLSSKFFIWFLASIRLFLISTNLGYSVSFSSLTSFSFARRSSSRALSSSICFLTPSSLLFISSILFSPVFCSP